MTALTTDPGSTDNQVPRETTPAKICLACGSWNTRIHGRVLDCRECETRYYVPAAQLVAADRALARLRTTLHVRRAPSTRQTRRAS